MDGTALVILQVQADSSEDPSDLTAAEVLRVLNARMEELVNSSTAVTAAQVAFFPHLGVQDVRRCSCTPNNAEAWIDIDDAEATCPVDEADTTAINVLTIGFAAVAVVAIAGLYLTSQI